MLTRSLVYIVLGLVVLYGLFEAGPILIGPTLSIISPVNGFVATSSVVAISGTALRTTSLELDGAPLLPDEHGHFSTTLAFPSGTSILTFTASDRFGRTITKTRTIVTP